MTDAHVVPVVAAKGLRQVSAWLHGWSGLLLGWLIFAMCLSGTLAIFKPEISRWLRPEISGPANPASAIVAATDYLRRAAPGGAEWFLTPPDGRANVTEATWADASAPGGYRTQALDPLTGRPDVARDTLGGEFFYRLHFELQLPYPWGRLLASLAAAFLLVAIVSGVFAHRRFFADFFTFRPAKGHRSWLDAHNLVGVVALPFHLMITYSGLLTLASLTMPWGVMSAYGTDGARMIKEFAPGFVERQASHRAAPLAPIGPMLMAAERRFGAGGRLGQVTVDHPGDAAATVTVIRFDGDQLAKTPEVVVFDGVTGRMISDVVERRPALRTYNVIYGLHMGRFSVGALRWFYFLCGLMLTATVASGLILWTVKRRDRPGGGRANEWLARFNIGVIAGTPTAFMAYFWANRLVAATAPGRSAIEVASVFWTLAAVILLALALPSRRGWAPLLALAAIACAGGPVLTMFDARPPAAGDWAIAGGNLVMAVAAVLFAAAAWRSTRHPVRRQRSSARG